MIHYSFTLKFMLGLWSLQKVQSASETLGQFDFVYLMHTRCSCYLVHIISASLFEISIHIVFLGPVVQSIVSLTSSLRGQLVMCFTTL